MTKPVRWGILGAANFARQHMGPAIHAAHGAELAALATSSPEKAAGFQAFAPGITVHPDYAALLADPTIEAVYIPLPNHLHVEWVLKALDAGKHVLCEKPIALQASQIDALIAARDRTGLLAAEAFMIAHHPQWHRVRALLADGAIGKLMHVSGAFTFSNSDPTNIRNKPDTGGGSLPDIGVYTFGSTRLATGAEPQRITSTTIERENGVDIFADVQADFPGFRYSAFTSIRMAPRQEMVFHGDAGVLRVHVPFNANVFGQARITIERGMDVTEERWPGVNHYVLQVQNFCASLRSGTPYPWTLEDAKGTQVMTDMVLAAENGQS